MSAPAPDLAHRYGAPSRTRRPLVVGLAVLLVAAGAAWLVWAVAFHGRPEVSSQLVGFTVRGEHRAEATFTVSRRNPGVRASCLLQALASDHAVVGEVTVPVVSGPADDRVRTTLRTERQADSVDLVGCSAPGQKAPR